MYVIKQRNSKMTEDEIVKLVESNNEEFKKFHNKTYIREDYSCCRCPEEYTCEWSYDPYNIGNDCLAYK